MAYIVLFVYKPDKNTVLTYTKLLEKGQIYSKSYIAYKRPHERRPSKLSLRCCLLLSHTFIGWTGCPRSCFAGSLCRDESNCATVSERFYCRYCQKVMAEATTMTEDNNEGN